jgi:glutamate transport system substrate-binding protein
MGRSRTPFAVGLAVLALAMSACATTSVSAQEVANNPTIEAGTTMAKIAAAGRMKVGTNFDQPGFGFKGMDGKVAGFDVEVAKIIAEAIGLTADNIEWVESPPQTREELIEQGSVDLVAATYQINTQSKERITFAGPYYVADQQLMVRSENALINGTADLRANPDKKVCSVTGSTPAERAKPYLASPAQLVLFDAYDKCAAALRTDQVQAVTADSATLLGLVANSDKAFKMVGANETYGIGVTKGDVKFCEFINETLRKHSAAYARAWADTAGQVEGAAPATLPVAAACS